LAETDRCKAPWRSPVMQRRFRLALEPGVFASGSLALKFAKAQIWTLSPESKRLAMSR